MQLNVAGRPVGVGLPPYIVAELSGNHGGKLVTALAAMRMAKDAGADAMKLQLYKPDALTLDHDGPGFTLDWQGKRRTLHDLYREAATPKEWFPDLFRFGREIGLTVFASVFDEAGVDYLEALGCPAYKIASFEITDLPLIRYAAKTGKPLIISTGMASRQEIDDAVESTDGRWPPILLKCTSAYPAPASAANLATMADLWKAFTLSGVGLSDHTMGHAVAAAATGLGACVIEKHLTLSRADGGPDAEFSMEPAEFAEMVRNVRTAWEALGTVSYGPTESEKGNVQFRRSLYVVRDIKAGEPFTRENVRSIRPGYGLAPEMLPKVLGMCSPWPIKRGTPLVESLCWEPNPKGGRPFIPERPLVAC